MGKLGAGILDGFYGKVGTVVGSFWKGIPIMRKWVRTISNPNTDEQKLTRAKFSLLGKLAGVFTPTINIGLKGRADKVKSTQQGEFVKLNYGVVTGSDPEALTVGYDEVKLSEGTFTGVDFGAPTFTNPLEVSVPISNAHTGEPGTSNDDPVIIAVYCPDMSQAVFSTTGKRSDTPGIVVAVPAAWQGMKVHVYGYTMPALGAKNRDNASATTYCGFGNIS